MRTKVAFLVSALVVLGLGACGGGGGSSRTIEVDYHSDDFAGAFIGYYPRNITVTPGMTLKFHQTWSGEPHSVTLGKAVDDGFNSVPNLTKIIDDYHAGKGLPDEPPPGYEEVFDQKLPSLFASEDGLNQGAALPCYLDDEKDLPVDGKACKKAQRKPVPFDGAQAYYSSGFIPFEGERGNTFDMEIADDAKEGTYNYYCNVHGAPMGGKITIKKGAKVESQASLNRRGLAEAQPAESALKTVLKKEQAGQGEFKPPLAGSGDDTTESVDASANEFTPRTLSAKVGDKVTWTFIGEHTISFNVPPYTPLFKFNKKGELEFNRSLDKAAGGWPGPPEDRGEENGPPPAPIELEAGDFDGSGGLKSSGTGFGTGDKYSVTFTKAGTYPYACLIHPGMIGKVVVK